MTPLSARTRETLETVLASYGLRAEETHDIRSGRVNRHWRAVAGGETYIVRRYHGSRTRAAIEYEHTVLDHVRREGWPVAAPVRMPDGGTIAHVDGASYALFPFLPGRPAPYGRPAHLRLRGALLARLHRDLASCPATGQRDGCGRLWELDTFVRAGTGFATLSELLRAFAATHRELAASVRREKYAMLRELARLGYGELAAAPCHFDFHRDNLLFQGGELTGLLDFDWVRLDARAADVANTIALDCLAPPTHNAIDPDAVRAFVGGYLEHTRLGDVELRLLVPLVRACMLWLVAFRLTQWAEGDRARAVRSIERSVVTRFPALAQRRRTLEEAVRLAAAGPMV